MNTKRIITDKDAKQFFDASINTIEDAFGVVHVDFSKRILSFNFNAVLLLSFEGIVADHNYSFSNKKIDATLISIFETLFKDKTHKAHSQYTNNNSYNHDFEIKQEHIDEFNARYIIISINKLFETEKQLSLFSHVVGSGLSLFTGCTWWHDYDTQKDVFYSSDSGPKILGMTLSKDKVYSIKEFETVREKAKPLSEFYEESIVNEIKSYEKVKNNKSDYFAGRTPTVTVNDEVIWVESYGKCVLRYPDGKIRYFIAIDIYMSEIHEEKTQLELLNNLINEGLTNSKIGIWYYQKFYKEGRFYFTNSFQKLMSDNEVYKNSSISNIIDEQIELTKIYGKGYENKLVEFRHLHNEIGNGKDNYHVVIPNQKNSETLQWIEVRGNVIERDEFGDVSLFVGVNVDITEAYQRNQELERLRIENERLQLAEKLAVKARNMMVWSQELTHTKQDFFIYGNELFNKMLGIKRNKDDLISFFSIRKSLMLDEEGKQYASQLNKAMKSIYKGEFNSFERILAKHKNLKTGKVLYIEHSVERTISDNGLITIGGVLLDVTDTINKEKQVRFLANNDTLSGLYNRNYFEQYISTYLPNNYSIILFDLDGLKLINDAYGHLIGDEIIKTSASMLKQAFFNAEFIARIGGDEFAIITRCTDEKVINDNINRLNTLTSNFNKTTHVELVLSHGIYTIIDSNESFDKAFTIAENIMYRRKLNNRSSRKSRVLESIIETLNAKTSETKEHSERLADSAIKIMKQLKMVRYDEIEDMKLLAKTHDIGKITIDDNILKKPGPLTEAEYEIIKKHAEAGYKIIRNITDSDSVCNGVLSHHERWDGKGYPQGLKGEEIPIFARIIAVADAFDAMTHDRVYRKRMTEEEALNEIIKNSGTQFDPKIVDAFTKVMKHQNNNRKPLN
jgi:diguanylate cyclase (GGDEF)-like protein